MKPKIATVVSFCTNEWRFLKACLSRVQPFSQQLLVTVCDHFFDGTLERDALLEEAYRQFPKATFLEFAYDPVNPYHYTSTLTQEHPHWRHLWHNTGRWISCFFLEKEIDYLYFCDADEIVDTERFLYWLDHFPLHHYSVLRLSSYRYFRDAGFQSRTFDLTGTFLRRHGLDPALLWSEHERMGIYLGTTGEKLLDVKGLDGKPLIHHYSWVRTQEELLQKVTTWGHYWERDWKGLIAKRYGNNHKRDFVRNQEYQKVEPYFDPLKVLVPVLPAISRAEHLINVKQLDNVRRVTREMMLYKELANAFKL